MTRARIVEALNLLGLLAEQEQLTLELCIDGGSAMMLAYAAREATKDVDVTAKPAEAVIRLARTVGERLGLDENWLNNDVRQFTSIEGRFAPLLVQDLEETAKARLKITRPSASYLLAMKCVAGRSSLPGQTGDMEDIEFLVRKMGLRSIGDVEEIVGKFYPDQPLTKRVRELILGVLARKEREK